jgi:DNA-binding beta-propeller fold protein YncE
MGSVLFLATALAVATSLAQAPRAQVIVLSNSSPHVSVIDTETNQVTKTASIPKMTSWTWNTDRNYYDGKNLWLGMRNPDTNDVEVVLLNLDTLQVTRRIPLGQDKTTLYIGGASRTGKVFIAKHASGQMAVIDTKTYGVKTINVPVNGGVSCDIDVVVGIDRKERAYIPTNAGNTVKSRRPARLGAGGDGQRRRVERADASAGASTSDG